MTTKRRFRRIIISVILLLFGILSAYLFVSMGNNAQYHQFRYFLNRFPDSLSSHIPINESFFIQKVTYSKLYADNGGDGIFVLNINNGRKQQEFIKDLQYNSLDNDLKNNLQLIMKLGYFV